MKILTAPENKSLRRAIIEEAKKKSKTKQQQQQKIQRIYGCRKSQNEANMLKKQIVNANS